MVSTLKLKMRTRRSDSANSIAAWTAVLSRATYVRVSTDRGNGCVANGGGYAVGLCGSSGVVRLSVCGV